jgi:glycerophosphoryl diester phosphodiesterase
MMRSTSTMSRERVSFSETILVTFLPLQEAPALLQQLPETVPLGPDDLPVDSKSVTGVCLFTDAQRTDASFARNQSSTCVNAPMFLHTATPSPLPAVIGHRGAKQSAPENTLASIREAKRLGVSVVEVDVMLSKDEVLFIHHDNTLDRCTDGKGYLWDHTAEKLRALDAGSHFSSLFANEPLPLLSELLLECRALGLGVNLEIKHATEHGGDIPNEEEKARERRLAEVTSSFIQQLGPTIAAPSKVLFSSFSIAALEVLAARLPSYQRSYLVEAIPDDWQQTYERLGCVSLNFNQRLCTREQVQAVSAKVPCFTYTVNDPQRAMELYAWGVSGVFSDCPKEILDCLSASSKGPVAEQL